MKLTVEEVTEILILSDNGLSDAELAKMFNVDKTTVSKLKKGTIKKGDTARQLIEKLICEAKHFSLSEEEKLFSMIPDKYKRKYFIEKYKKYKLEVEKYKNIKSFWNVDLSEINKEANEIREELLKYKKIILENNIVSKQVLVDNINYLTTNFTKEDKKLLYAISNLYKLIRDEYFDMNNLARKGIIQFCSYWCEGDPCGLRECICEKAIDVIKEFRRECIDSMLEATITEKENNWAFVNRYCLLSSARRILNNKTYFLNKVNRYMEKIDNMYRRAWNVAGKNKDRDEWYSPDNIRKDYDELNANIEDIFNEISEILKEER